MTFDIDLHRAIDTGGDRVCTARVYDPPRRLGRIFVQVMQTLIQLSQLSCRQIENFNGHIVLSPHQFAAPQV